MFTEHAMTFPAEQFVPVPAEQPPQSLVPLGEEILTPEQFFTYSRNSGVSWTGERRLLLAVLEEAVANFLRYRHATTTRGKRLFREEYEWFWSQEKNYLYAFETICDHLHLDPDYIRAGLQKCRRVSDAMPVTIETRRFASYRRVEL